MTCLKHNNLGRKWWSCWKVNNATFLARFCLGVGKHKGFITTEKFRRNFLFLACLAIFFAPMVMGACSSNYSEWNTDEKWSSQEWKSDELMEVRTVRLVNEQAPGLFTQHTDRCIVDDDDVDSNTVAESDVSLKSRSFFHRVTDRVRKMLDHSSKDATQDSNKHSLIW